MNEKENISLINEDGSLKSKKQFIEEMERVYDHCILENEECENLYELCLCPETQFHYEEVSSTFNFLDRTIYIDEEITTETAKMVFDKIRLWNRAYSCGEIDEQPIKIYINSVGGDLVAAFSIISAIRVSKLPIYTYNIGMAYSAALLILVSGHKRFGFPLSSYLFHEGSAATMADAHKLIQQVDFYKRELKQTKDIIIRNTTITPELYEDKKKDDWWFDEQEALKNGIIDEIIDTIVK